MIIPRSHRASWHLYQENTKFFWGPEQTWAFQELKDKFCSDNTMVPYDTTLHTRQYVDSSLVGTQATVAQKHIITGEVHWRPVNNTSRSWTSAEARYGQIEQESNGIITGMYIGQMYTLGTLTEVVTDHEPFIHIYNDPRRPKQLVLIGTEQSSFHLSITLPLNLEKTHLVAMAQDIHLDWGPLQRISNSSGLFKMMLISLLTESLKTSCNRQ